MARRVAAVRHKTKIPFVHTHNAATKVFHPQAISDAFSEYYGNLYNLKNNTTIPFPSDKAINSFLAPQSPHSIGGPT